MTKSSFTKPSVSRPADRRHENARTCCPGGRVWYLLIAVVAVGLTAAGACFAWNCAGSTRDIGAADEGAEQETPTLSVPPSQADSSPAVETGQLEAEPVWQTDYQEALALAVEQGRPVLLRFTAEWCMPCQVMDRSVFPDQDVKAAIAAHAVPVKIDVDEERNADVARRYGIRGIPSLVLVDADGNELDRGGFMSAEALVEFVRKS